MRLAFAPPVLVLVSIAVVVAQVALAPNDASALSSAMILGGVIGYFVGTDWWLARMSSEPIAEGGRRRRLAGILALGAPATLWTLGLFAVIVAEGDNMWMMLPYALAPALIVWPFVVAALRKMQATKSSPARQIG